MKNIYRESIGTIKKLLIPFYDYIGPLYYYFKDAFDYGGNKLLKKNYELKDKYLGETCFLLLTGESLSQVDIKKLSDHYTFGVGFIFLHKNIEKINLNFYLLNEPLSSFYNSRNNISEGTVPTSWPEKLIPSSGKDKAILYHEKLMDKLAKSNTTFFVNADNSKFYNKHHIFDNKKIVYIKEKGFLHKHANNIEKIELTLTKRFDSGGGSIYTSLLLLMNMGFKTIYLAGAGYSYYPKYEHHFYDNFVYSSKQFSPLDIELRVRSILKKHYGHNDSIKYLGLNKAKDEYRAIIVNYEKTDIRYSLINEIAMKNDVRIINILPEGFVSPVFDSATWEELKL